ncbi:oxidoreductase C-terminal domain-containing protein, partial [Streptomyces sp. NPDC056121]
AGRRKDGDQVRVVEGAVEDGSFLALYEREGVTTAALAVDRPRPFTRVRRELARGEARPVVRSVAEPVAL